MRSLINCLVIAIPLTLGSIVSRSVAGTNDLWYSQLQKPIWTPPGWVFGVVWPALYLAMGVSALIIWRKGTLRATKRRALGFFAGQLVLNLAWTPLFFGAQQPLWALWDLSALVCVLSITCIEFARIDRWAGALLVPYALWTLCALTLNWRILQLNA